MLVRFPAFLIFISLFFVHPLVQADHTEVEQRYSKQREAYKELTALLRAGALATAISRRHEIDGYPLTDYFDYLVLRQQIAQSSMPSEFMRQVATQKADKRLHRRLLGAVKNRSVELKRWQDYNLALAEENAPYHPCDDLLAGLINGQPKRFVKQTSDLWSAVDLHTGNCDKAFSILLKDVSDVPTAALWHRTVALIKRAEFDSVRSLLKYFNRRDGQIVRAWIDGVDNPAQALQAEVAQGKTVHHKSIAEFLLRRWARDDLPAALRFWRANGERFGFSQKDVSKAVAKYAVLSVKRGLPESGELLDSATQDRDVRYWRVRLALREKDWQQCIANLNQLTETEQAMPRWRYWRARCLESQGFSQDAERIYASIAGEFEYYGFLAADKLSQGYSIKSVSPPDADVHDLKDEPQIIKALEYFFVDLPWEGRREWNRALENASKARFLAAAHLAESVGWYDRALGAAFNADATDSLRWLFPEAYKANVTPVASRHNVPREFVYGVMRRESRFTSDIKSSAGAVGLMQLMPGTAKQMGQELGIEAPVGRLIDSELNIKLGVRYLEYVLDRFDKNFAFAAAAYNAGPSRVKKWIEDRPIDSDLWIETIPFDETRAYVQAVLFNTAVFEWLTQDGRVTRLENRMSNLAVSQLQE